MQVRVAQLRVDVRADVARDSELEAVAADAADVLRDERDRIEGDQVAVAGVEVRQREKAVAAEWRVVAELVAAVALRTELRIAEEGVVQLAQRRRTEAAAEGGAPFRAAAHDGGGEARRGLPA